MKILILFLTCANQAEANTISHVLLEKRLVACVKMLPVTSQFLWQESVDNANEILLIMDTVDTQFERIEQEIRKVHSYQTFVLTAIEVIKSSAGVLQWVQETLK